MWSSAQAAQLRRRTATNAKEEASIEDIQRNLAPADNLGFEVVASIFFLVRSSFKILLTGSLWALLCNIANILSINMPRGYHQALYHCYGHCYYDCYIYVQAFVLVYLLCIANMITNKLMNTSVMISYQGAGASQG
jgi:hypothetical protein